jgi:hypothetical protein
MACTGCQRHYTPERFADAWSKGFVAEGWALVELDPTEATA